MKLLRLLAQRAGRELARHPEARGTAEEVLATAQRVLNDDIKPRAQQARRDAQPEIANAKRRLTRVAQDLRDEYRKGRDVAQLPTNDGELAAKQLNELRG